MPQGLSVKGPVSRGSTVMPALVGETHGDLAYWDYEAKEWVVLPAPEDTSKIYVLGFKDGAPAWLDTAPDCAPPAP